MSPLNTLWRSGPAQIGAGQALIGAASLLSIALASRAMPTTELAVLTTWFLTANLVALIFTVFEGYLPRVLQGELRPRTAAACTRMLFKGLLVVLLVTAIVLAAMPVLVDESIGLAVLLLGYVVFMALQSLVRSFAIAGARFRVYLVMLGADGGTRLLLTVLVVAVGLSAPVWFAFAFVVGALTGLVAGSVVQGNWWSWRYPQPGIVNWLDLGRVFPATLGIVMINNLPAPWLAAQHVDAGTLVAVSAALILSRVPTQFAAAAFAPSLHVLSRDVDENNEPAFRFHLRRAGLLAAAAGLFFIAFFVALRQPLLTAFVGSEYSVSALIAGALAAASALLLLGAVFRAGLAARRDWSGVALPWISGIVVMIIVLSLPVDPVLRAVASPTLAALVAVAGLWLRVARSPVSVPQ